MLFSAAGGTAVAGGTAGLRSFLHVVNGNEAVDSDVEILLQTGDPTVGAGGGSQSIRWGNLNQVQFSLGTGKDATPASQPLEIQQAGFVSGNPTLFQLHPGGDLNLDGTGAFTPQRGTTGERPSVPVNGMIRYNSSTAAFEGYQAGSWQNLIGGGGAGGGAWEFVSTSTAANDTFIEFNNLTETAYKIIVIDFVPSIDFSSLRMRLSNDNGTTFVTTNYQWNLSAVKEGSTSITTDSSGTYLATGAAPGTAAGEFSSQGEVNFFSMNTTGQPAYFQATFSHMDGSDGDNVMSTTNGVSADDNNGGSTLDIDAIQFLMSSGNILTGEFHLYKLVTA